MEILTFVGISGCNFVIAVLDKKQLKGRGFTCGHSLKGYNPPWQQKVMVAGSSLVVRA